MPIAIVNLGGVRGEEAFFKKDMDAGKGGEAEAEAEDGVRCSERADTLLPLLVKRMGGVMSGGVGVEDEKGGGARVGGVSALGRME